MAVAVATSLGMDWRTEVLDVDARLTCRFRTGLLFYRAGKRNIDTEGLRIAVLVGRAMNIFVSIP